MFPLSSLHTLEIYKSDISNFWPIIQSCNQMPIESLQNLRVLKLNSCISRDFELTGMPEVIHQLEVLDISNTKFVGVRPLAPCELTVLPDIEMTPICLKELYFNDTYFEDDDDDDDFDIRLIGILLKNLEVLEMTTTGRCNVTNNVMRCNVTNNVMSPVPTVLRDLRHLCIDGWADVTEEVVEEIANNLKKLEVFHLSRTHTTPYVVNHFFKLPKLKDVKMGRTDAVALMKLSQLRLISLAIDVEGVSREGFRHLHKCKTLKKLSLHSHAFGADTEVGKYIGELKAKLPQCEVVTSSTSLVNLDLQDEL